VWPRRWSPDSNRQTHRERRLPSPIVIEPKGRTALTGGVLRMQNCGMARVSKTSRKPFPADRMGRARAHQQIAEDLLQRSERAGFFDVLTETRLATIATAHAALALSYLMSPAEVEPPRPAESSPAGPACMSAKAS
jgi:hypothetical protein